MLRNWFLVSAGRSHRPGPVCNDDNCVLFDECSKLALDIVIAKIGFGNQSCLGGRMTRTTHVSSIFIELAGTGSEQPGK